MKLKLQEAREMKLAFNNNLQISGVDSEGMIEWLGNTLDFMMFWELKNNLI